MSYGVAVSSYLGCSFLGKCIISMLWLNFSRHRVFSIYVRRLCDIAWHLSNIFVSDSRGNKYWSLCFFGSNLECCVAQVNACFLLHLCRLMLRILG